MNRTVAGAITLWALLCAHGAEPWTVWAYELQVHQRMSEHAFDSCYLTTDLPAQLRIASDRILNRKLPIDWVAEGSRDEDNNLSVQVVRVRNHFYNPLTGRALTGVTGNPAPDWALEDADEISGQDYSMRDARDHFYKALTEQSPSTREDELRQTFYRIGHVIHLLQDMAQPQHTRDDFHAWAAIEHMISLGQFPTVGEQMGTYEQYTDLVNGSLPYGGYDPVYGDADVTTFNTARKFFTTHDPDNAPSPGGKGIADYSNRGFVSAGRNFRELPLSFDLLPAEGFPWPDGSGAIIDTVRIEDLPPANFGPAPNLIGEIDFIGTPVTDTYRNSAYFNPRTSTYSVFDDALRRKNLPAHFGLNRFR